MGRNSEYLYSVGDQVQTVTGILTILSLERFEHGKKRISTQKGYTYKCSNCGNEHTIIENQLSRGGGCNVCGRSPRKVLKGYNDIATTNPDLVKYFLNKEDSHLYTRKSDTMVSMICDCCGHIREYTPHRLTVRGFICPHCSGGISYPNRLMYNVCLQLKDKKYIHDFDRESRFDWCTYPNYLDDNKLDFGVYDIVIEDEKIIIEMDGALGHGKVSIGDKSIDESIYKDIQKDTLAEKHGYKIIRIDCDYKDVARRFDYIMNNVVKELGIFFDLSVIDWDDIKEKCMTSEKKLICDFRNKNPHMSASQISQVFKMSKTTISNYLKEFTALGLCDYSPEDEKRNASKRNGGNNGQPVQIIKDGKILKTFTSRTDLCDNSLKLFNVKLDSRGVNKAIIENICYKGFNFKDAEQTG